MKGVEGEALFARLCKCAADACEDAPERSDYRGDDGAWDLDALHADCTLLEGTPLTTQLPKPVAPPASIPMPVPASGKSIAQPLPEHVRNKRRF